MYMLLVTLYLVFADGLYRLLLISEAVIISNAGITVGSVATAMAGERVIVGVEERERELDGGGD